MKTILSFQCYWETTLAALPKYKELDVDYQEIQSKLVSLKICLYRQLDKR